jgi:uncharacterized protein YqgV (UPF0045/DUF77 family)
VIRVEFTVYPFIEGAALPPHAQAAVDAIVSAGFRPEMGPLSQSVIGEAEPVLEAVRAAALAALREGARRVVVNVEVVSDER